MLNKRSTKIWIFAAASLFVGATLFFLTGPVSAHKKTHSNAAVSYTHLTLPTILLV